MSKKRYCVHVYERRDYEDILAENPQDAEDKVMREFYNTMYDDVSEVVVLLTCQECHLDNEPTNVNCDECGEKL